MGGKVLVVDDDPVGIVLMERRLTKAGYEVSVAFNGELALKSVNNEQPALIILDVEMPEMSGYAFVFEFRKIEAMKHVPIIVLTAHEENQKIFARKGIPDYLLKPVDFDKLFAVMERLLGHS